MDIKKTQVFTALSNLMAREEKKMEVAAENLGRAHIPGAKMKVLKESSFAAHLNGGAHQPPKFRVEEVTNKENRNLSGNSINPHEELRALQEAYTKTYEAQMQYQALLKRVKMLIGGKG